MICAYDRFNALYLLEVSALPSLDFVVHLELKRSKADGNWISAGVENPSTLFAGWRKRNRKCSIVARNFDVCAPVEQKVDDSALEMLGNGNPSL